MSWDWEKLKEQQRYKGGNVPPQWDEFFKRLNNMKFPGGPLLVGLLILGILLGTMVYTVRPSEVGIIQRFGRYIRTTQPGLHFKLPVGIEEVKRVNIRRVETEEFISLPASRDSRYPAAATDPTLMLTGDLNVGQVPWVVQYRIKDPYNYLFKVRDVQLLLRDMSEATMRLVIGDRSIDEVISNRDEIAVEAQGLLQQELDQAETGIHVVTLELKKTDVPAPVQPSLNEVNQATQEKEQMIYKAREEYNRAIPAARGEAERTVRAAEGYALDRVNTAKGDAARFTAIYEEYVKAKDVTRRRMYLEALREILPKLERKTIIDEELGGVLPLLNLDKGIGATQ
ncbi:MAG: FtsH protease activity modulator HflK [Thermodesulfobacteriota bacterium]